MPATTLWRAMRSERRPISMASATRSTRSTAITASAVSEETVAPAEAHGDAHVGRRQRRRVVDAVAHHHDRPALRSGPQRPDDPSLPSGDRSAWTSSTPSPRATPSAAGRRVAGDHRDVAHAGRPQPGDAPGGVLPEASASTSAPASRPSTPTSTGAPARRGRRARRRRAHSRARGASRRLPAPYPPPVHRALDPQARTLVDVGRRRSRGRAPRASLTIASRDDVGGHLLHATRPAGGARPAARPSRAVTARPPARRWSACRSCRAARRARGRAPRSGPRPWR